MDYGYATCISHKWNRSNTYISIRVLLRFVSISKIFYVTYSPKLHADELYELTCYFILDRLSISLSSHVFILCIVNEFQWRFVFIFRRMIGDCDRWLRIIIPLVSPLPSSFLLAWYTERKWSPSLVIIKYLLYHAIIQTTRQRMGMLWPQNHPLQVLINNL